MDFAFEVQDRFPQIVPIFVFPQLPSPNDSQRHIFVPNESDLNIKSRDRLTFKSIDDVINFVHENKDAADSPKEISEDKSSDYFLRTRKRMKLNDCENMKSEKLVSKKATVVLDTGTRNVNNAKKVDDSWKAGNLIFKKRESSVGAEYQVSEIPKAGSYLDPQNERSES
jgi:hypothetical protein